MPRIDLVGTRRAAKVLVLCVLVGVPPVCEAHHTMTGVPVRSAKCGWLQGDSLRDLRNLSDFCANVVAGRTYIGGVASHRERLWIEAPPEFAADVRTGERAAQQRLASWLAAWRRISGYRHASVAIVTNHVDVVTVVTR